MNESSAIVRYLWKKYATNVVPEWPRPTPSYNLASLQDFKKMRSLEDGACLAPPSHNIWRILDVPTLVASSFVRPLPRHGVMLRPSHRLYTSFTHLFCKPRVCL